MPTYNFRCDKCKALFDKQASMADAPSKAKCPHCRTICGRHYGEMNFILKGGDWPSKAIKTNQTITKKSKIEDVMNDRAKKGLNPGKEKKMSEAEFQKRLALNKKWIEESGK